MFCQQVYMSTTWMAGVLGGQKWVPDPLEIELQVVVGCHFHFWEPNLGCLREQQAFLAVDLSLQCSDGFLNLTESLRGLSCSAPCIQEEHHVGGDM